MGDIEVDILLANIYGPNKNVIKYLMVVITEFTDFKKGGAIMTGDFNFCLDPRINSMSHVQGTGIALRTKSKKDNVSKIN